MAQLGAAQIYLVNCDNRMILSCSNQQLTQKIASSPKHLPTTYALWPTPPSYSSPPSFTGYRLHTCLLLLYTLQDASPPSWQSLLSPNLTETILTPADNHSPTCHVTPSRSTHWNIYHVTLASSPLSPTNEHPMADLRSPSVLSLPASQFTTN